MIPSRAAEPALAADALPRCLLCTLSERAAEARRYAASLLERLRTCERLLLNMCLTLSVELPMKKGEAELIVSRYNSITLDFHFDGTTSFLGRGNPCLSISEKGEGCACSILTDEADWNADIWDIRVDVLPDLALALLFIYELASAGYIFQALWAGDKPEKNVEVSLDEILQIVQRNQIGTKTRYIVRAA